MTTVDRREHERIIEAIGTTDRSIVETGTELARKKALRSSLAARLEEMHLPVPAPQEPLPSDLSEGPETARAWLEFIDRFGRPPNYGELITEPIEKVPPQIPQGSPRLLGNHTMPDDVRYDFASVRALLVPRTPERRFMVMAHANDATEYHLATYEDFQRATASCGRSSPRVMIKAVPMPMAGQIGEVCWWCLKVAMPAPYFHPR